MKEQMFSAIDALDKLESLFWVKGDFMCVSSDFGSDDPWRKPGGVFEAYPETAFESDRMIDPVLLWERDE